MANILYRGSATPSTVNSAGGKNAALTNLEIDQNFYALDRDKFDRILGGTISGNATFDSSSTVTINGNLIVNGTTTTINSTTLTVDDINITLGDVSTPSNATANGGGITLRGATDKTFNWYSSNSAWNSSESLALAAGKALYLSGSSSGTVTLVAQANAGTPTINLPTNSGTFALLGDIGNGTITVNTGSGLTGSGSFTTNQGSAATITLSHSDTSTQASSNNSGNTFIQSITLDDYGHITGLSTGSVTIGNGTFTVSAGSGMTGGGQLGTANQSGNSSVTLTHATTTSQGSVSNSGGTIIQSISLDANFGHVTGISSLDGDGRWLRRDGGYAMTGRLNITAGASGGIAFPNDAFSGTGDTATITLQNPAGGEATRMTFTMTNDPDDMISFVVPSNDGVLINGNRVWHAGNLTNNNQLSNGSSFITADGRAYPRRSDGGDLNFYWSGQSGQPTWLWGGSDGANMYVYNPSNFSVNYANSSGSAGTSTYLTPISGEGSYRLAYTADGQRTNPGEWGRVVMYYPPNSQTYGVRVDRADYADSSGSCSGNSATASAVGSLSNNGGYAKLMSANYLFFNNADNTRGVAQYNAGGANTTTLQWWNFGGPSATYMATLDGSGNFTVNSNITANSDIRLKSNVETIENGLSKVLSLRGVSYDKDGKRNIGVIAQEVREIIPEVVLEADDEAKTLSVAYGNIVGVLIEAIKELNAKVEDLQNQLANK